MIKVFSIAAFLFLLAGSLSGQKHLPGFENNWAQWRGPYDS
ncbi:MAG: hypothetical protein P1P86_13870 [Bacteroidales bacterium]|nr:hypothetical protein [Bacteroidales bacterium]